MFAQYKTDTQWNSAYTANKILFKASLPRHCYRAKSNLNLNIKFACFATKLGVSE